MKLLLDSHLLIWWPMGSPRLGRRASELILDDKSQLFMSAVSWWELGIKNAIGKLDIDLVATRRLLEAHAVTPLSLTVEHGKAAAALPLLHRDPFDHLLVARAQFEGLQLLTRDIRLAVYGSAVLHV